MTEKKRPAKKAAPKALTLFDRIGAGMTLNIEGQKLRVILKGKDSLTLNLQGRPVEWSRELIDNYPAGGICLL